MKTGLTSYHRQKTYKTNTDHSRTILLRDQQQKHTTTDPLEDIFQHNLKNNYMHKQNTHHKQSDHAQTNQTHKHITPSKGLDSNQINKEANSEQVISDKR